MCSIVQCARCGKLFDEDAIKTKKKYGMLLGDCPHCHETLILERLHSIIEIARYWANTLKDAKECIENKSLAMQKIDEVYTELMKIGKYND